MFLRVDILNLVPAVFPDRVAILSAPAVCMYVCMCVGVFVCVWICTYVCVECMYMCGDVCMSAGDVCMCIAGQKIVKALTVC
jgi:hypothetical protein